MVKEDMSSEIKGSVRSTEVEKESPTAAAQQNAQASIMGNHTGEALVQDTDGTAATEETRFLNSNGQPTEPPVEQSKGKLKQMCVCPPQGVLANVITKVFMLLLVFGVVWSITGSECLPGGNLFGILALMFFAVLGGKLMGLIKIPTLPPLPPLLGMLLAGFLLRNIPVVNDAIQIDHKWSASLRNIALAIILTRAGLGLDQKALRKLKAVCLRLAMGPCITEACSVAVVAHFLMGMPWIWGFILGFVLGAVSPAVVVPSMLILQKQGYGVEQGVPTLLMAAGSFDDILAITGFNTCLGMAFSSGATWYNILRGALEVFVGIAAGLMLGFFIRYFPSKDQKQVVLKRAYLILALSVFSVFASSVLGFPGSGGLCTLVMAFIAGVGWADDKGAVEDIVGIAWDIFQPLLFSLIGAEISVTVLKPETVGLGVATLMIALLIRIVVTFFMVTFAGFSFKEKIFISLAWIPKATVQAAIGSVALDTARTRGDTVLEKYGMDILTVAFLGILITAPIGALIIGLAGPRLLQKPNKETQDDNAERGREECEDNVEHQPKQMQDPESEV
ncbi:sodium/hydrogen exchanger 9B2 isoform X2 [Latimeria chalumnae]|uniref:sodium/hydrogen exchanger 9B2 isoform X2 n=1 Tax=Latimeria chalumnae TaxID=7897 RepID=UPI00313CCC74